jgi:hypothetical protein
MMSRRCSRCSWPSAPHGWRGRAKRNTRSNQCDGVRTAQAGATAATRSSAARTHCLSAACGMPVLRRNDLAQDRRGRDRDAGAHPASVESDPARAREVLLPCLRSDHAAAGALTPNHACQIASNSDPFSRPRTTPLMEPVSAGRNWWRGHSRSELPGQDVAGEVLEHVVGQAPTDELEVGKVGLPKLVGRRRGLAKWSAAFIRMKASWLHPERLLPKFHRDALRRFSTPTLLPATSL